MNLLIKNGTVINAGGSSAADVAVDGGKIISVGPDIEPGVQTEVVDASGLLVLPGAVDVHTHFELDFGWAFRSADDFYNGTKAAACGGVTTVIDFVTPEKGESLIEALDKRKALADPKVCIDYSLHMGLSEVNDKILDEMGDVITHGVPDFKIFTTYAFRLTDDEFIRTLTRAKELNSLVMIHAEDHEELEAKRVRFISEGKTDAWYHYLSRPEEVEAKSVKNVIELAKKTGATIYIVHLACAEGLKAVEEAQRQGYPIYAETCPQYLHFTSDVYKRPDARNFVCSPPIKGQESQDALWAAVKQGDRYSVSFSRNETEYLSPCFTVATDHCPFNSSDKDYGKDDFTMIPNGVMGVENLYPYMLSKANEGQISFERAVELCSANPARIFKLSPRKGAIEAGADADIVIYDPGKNFTISQKNMHSTIDYTIWEGTKLKGYPIKTYTRGNLIYNNGEFTGKPGHGRFYPRS
ncbi:MAG: dihydropyrimidinase [Oscillospiraceae bacterium]|nr:dihydropyrimidinase [Oscillospiraceae bacterium]